MQKKNKTIIRH